MAISSISVVVLTYNRAAELLVTLGKLREHEPGVPIVVVDNASTDNTIEQVRRRFSDVTLLRCSHNMGAAGRNLGVDQLRTPYVAFCDDDTWWENGSLSRAAAILDKLPDCAALNARVLVGTDGALDETCAAMARSPIAPDAYPGPTLTGYMAGATVFRAAVFRTVGGYQPRFFIGGEEELVSLDLLASGWRIAYAPMLTLRHCPSPLRDAGQRRQLLRRNAVWVAIMRLPWADAAKRFIQALIAMRRNRTLLVDGLDMLRGLPWALRHRSPLSANVLDMLAAVRASEQQDVAMRSTATDRQ